MVDDLGPITGHKLVENGLRCVSMAAGVENFLCRFLARSVASETLYIEKRQTCMTSLLRHLNPRRAAARRRTRRAGGRVFLYVFLYVFI